MSNDYSALIAPLQEIFPPIAIFIDRILEVAPLAKDRPLFRLMSASEMLDVRKRLAGIAPVHDSLLLAFTNDAGDYFGPWIQGAPAFGWAWYRHDGNDLMPVIRDVTRLKAALEKSAGAKGLPGETHDYPDFNGTATEQDVEHDRLRVAGFREELGDTPPSPMNANAWFAYAMIMQLTPKLDLDSLVPFLDAADPWAKELAVATLGGHRHAPSRKAIEEIAKGSGNAALVAGPLLERWKWARAPVPYALA